MNFIDTEKASISLRGKAIIPEKRELLITNFNNSEQEKDFSEPANCNGYGRVRHFKLHDSNEDWPSNPLPIVPALNSLKLPKMENIRAQVFQNAVCNWRCWYCFVDFKLLSGNKKYSDYLTCDTMLEYYLNQDNPPLMLDLTGGQPDITPEWIPWMMETLIQKGLSEKIYVWSDDNLSNDYFWKYLTKDQIELISNYKMYGRVCCFKGIDETSFVHNTGASPEFFHVQFKLWEKLLKTGMDLYSYITLSAPTSTDFASCIRNFLDRIQSVDEMYPLRIVPLRIQVFTPMVSRIKDLHQDLMEGQKIAINVWKEELSKRFSKDQLESNIGEFKTKYQT
jgi:uncharacterized Fe-S cluster-containing radical SAM superfamily protein